MVAAQIAQKLSNFHGEFLLSTNQALRLSSNKEKGGCMRTRLTAATRHETSLELVTNDVRVNFHQSSFAHHDHELHDFHVD